MAISVNYLDVEIKPEFITRYSATGFNSHERDPAIIALADGGFAVVYEWQSIGTPTNQMIFLERYDSAGNFRPAAGFDTAIFLGSFQFNGPNVTQPSRS